MQMKIHNILYKVAIFSLLSQPLSATSLKQIIDSTLVNNQNIQAQDYEVKSAKENYKSAKNIFHPTLNIGANHLRLDKDMRQNQIGSTTTGYVKLGLNIYDGGKSIATKNQKNYQYQSAQFNNITTKKQTILQTITLYFNTKTVTDNIKVYKEKAIALKAEYQRMQEKYDIKMATKDEVLKLQAEYDSNSVIIEELKYQQMELLQNLNLMSGVGIGELEKSLLANYNLPNTDDISYQNSPNIKALELSIKAQNESTKSISSLYKPTLKIEDSLNFYKYDDYNNKLLTDLPDTQNQLMINLNFNLFDTSSSKQVEASKYAKLSLENRLQYLKSQEKMKFELSKRKLQTQKSKIKSLKSAVKMGESVYEIVKLKYQNGIVDNITYLDALSKKVYNLALYRQALNDYEIAKANYYFASGVEYEEVLKDW